MLIRGDLWIFAQWVKFVEEEFRLQALQKLQELQELQKLQALQALQKLQALQARLQKRREGVRSLTWGMKAKDNLRSVRVWVVDWDGYYYWNWRNLTNLDYDAPSIISGFVCNFASNLNL